jgi:signal transduction histidine kinase
MPVKHLVTQNDIRKTVVQSLYGQGYLAQAGGLISGLIYAWASRKVLDPTAHLIWCSCFFSIYFVRSIFHLWFRKTYIKTGKEYSPKKWEIVFTLGTLASGLCWAAVSTVLLPKDLEGQALLGFLLAGNTAGAIVAYCASIRTTLAFFIPAILPFAVKEFSLPGESHTTMGFMLSAYCLIMSGLIVRMNRYVVDSFILKIEQQLLIEELKETQIKVANSTKMAALGEMAGGIAHEINNPLAAIQFNTSILKDMAKSGNLNGEAVNNIVGKVEATVLRITKIIAGLKSFAREGNHDPFQVTPIEKIVTETLELCKNRFKNNGVVLDVDPISPDLAIVCREVQVSQVLLNLLNNSFDAVQNIEDAWVKIEAWSDDETAFVAVTDCGSGIPEEIKDKIMEPFFTTKGVGKGTGLGLSISHGIMLEHDGQLLVDTSWPNTRFVLKFPKAVLYTNRAAA